MLHNFVAKFSLVIVTLCISITPLSATTQMTEVDPNTVIDSDLDAPQIAQPSIPPEILPFPDPSLNDDLLTGDVVTTPAYPPDAANTIPGDSQIPEETTQSERNNTYEKKDLIGVAQGIFGKGAQGLAGLIEKILKDQGQPNAYIVGREASAALVFGLRYGSGILYHKIEGERPIYWTGPSLGFDAGINAAKTFVLVYNLYDTEDIFKRYVAGEGAAYLVGGLNASYLRHRDVVLIPIRVGVGVRLGANIGYMKFRKKQKWLPF